MDVTSDVRAILNSLPRPAILLGRDYRILLANDAYRATYGFSDRTVRRCHEVSHRSAVPCDLAGESCPLRESLETGEPTRVLHVHHTPRGEEYVNVEMWPVKDPETGEVRYFIEQMHPSDAGAATPAEGRLVGRSPAFQEMLHLVQRVAASEVNVMLLGETGTGKEAVAQTIHQLGGRASGPFVPVECTGLPESLFETELFGHVRGAFTGATSGHTGLVAAAEGGTLFLDEIGDVPIAGQVKLLRLLETRRYRQVGSTEWKEADFRVICATNRDLPAMVQAGSFREDLFYRLAVFEIRLPPLRDRPEDLELLAATILGRLGRSEMRLSQEALLVLREHRFPGNVRELRNMLERAVILAETDVVHPRHLQLGERATPAGEEAGRDELETLAQAERRHLARALRRHTGDRKSLARALGISERALYRKIAGLRDG